MEGRKVAYGEGILFHEHAVGLSEHQNIKMGEVKDPVDLMIFDGLFIGTLLHSYFIAKEDDGLRLMVSVDLKILLHQEIDQEPRIEQIETEKQHRKEGKDHIESKAGIKIRVGYEKDQQSCKEYSQDQAYPAAAAGEAFVHIFRQVLSLADVTIFK